MATQKFLTAQITLLALIILVVHLVTASDSTDLKVILYAQQRFRGDNFKITGLKKIGDCREFWNPKYTVDSTWSKFNDRSYSIALGEGVCVRLYENDCDWTRKGRTLDTTPNSGWVSDFGLVGFGGIVSAVKIIECPTHVPPLVTFFKEINYQGSKVDLYELQKIGDCVELWSPLGYDALISQHLRRFDNQAKSIKLRDGVCVRLHEHACEMSRAKMLDMTPFSAWTNDLSRMWFNGILSAVELIACPEPSGIIAYSSVNFQGESLALDGLREVGDCVEFWNPAGYGVQISEDLRRFNDKMQSIKIPVGLCVRLNRDHCGGSGRSMDNVTSDTIYASNLGRQYFGGVVSSVELTCEKSSAAPTTSTPSIFKNVQVPTAKPDVRRDARADDNDERQNCPAVVEPKPCVCPCDPLFGAEDSAENEIGDEPEITNSHETRETPKKPIFLEIPKTTVKPKPETLRTTEKPKLPETRKTTTTELPRIQPTTPKLIERIEPSRAPVTTVSPSSSSPNSDVWKIIGALKCIDIPPSLIEETGSIFQYYISGVNGGDFYLDLKNPPGKIATGRSEEEPDVTFKISDVHFVQLMTEQITGAEAFRNAYVVIGGGWFAMMKAQSLEAALQKLKDQREKIDLLNAPRYC